jgi:rubrerythrin
MGSFKASEILEIAIKIEENGEALYRHAVTLTEDEGIKRLFASLADEEVKHRKTFEEMVSKLESYQPQETYPGEYFAYLRAYAENIIFPKEALEEELEGLYDAEDAVEFAQQREIESILYYLEAKSAVPPSQAAEIDKIIDEERAHYLKLVDVRRTLD